MLPCPATKTRENDSEHEHVARSETGVCDNGFENIGRV